MIRSLGIFAAVGFLAGAGIGNAGESPVSISHKLIGNSSQNASVDLEYSLHVVNISNGALSNLKLSFAPYPPIGKAAEIVVGALAPGQGTDLKFRLQTPVKGDHTRKSRMPLWWDARAVDAAGFSIHFPVKSTAEVPHE